MQQVIKAPTQFYDLIEGTSIFLAGSIEMGKAVDWQTRVTRALEKRNCTILNPRRDDWDSSWTQEITNTQFKEQVVWELSAQESSDLILMYFDPNTQSPITLLELGLFGRPSSANMASMVVCCPEGFWRKGNVDVVCERYGIDQVDSLEELIEFADTYCLAAEDFDRY